MQTIAIISQKGGAGKTTLSLNLSVEAERRNLNTLVIDIDPQASSAQWGDHRDDSTPVIISAQPSRIDGVLKTARENNADLVIIDTAPHSDNAALAAARSADQVLIPCRPSVLDLRAISQSVDIASLAGKRPVIVLNATPPRGGLAQDAAEVVAGYNADVSPIFIAQRAAFMHSLTVGKTACEYDPNSKAANEITALFDWLIQKHAIM